MARSPYLALFEWAPGPAPLTIAERRHDGEIAALLRGERPLIEQALRFGKSKHPGLCRVLGRGRDDISEFVALEWTAGITLTDLIGSISREGFIPIQICCRLASHLVGARLALKQNAAWSAHDVLIRYRGEPTLLPPRDAGSTFIPKELPQNRVELYMLGQILYELLTGEQPFESVDVPLEELFPNMVSDFRRDAPPELEELVQDLLATSDEIPLTLKEVAERLDAIAAEEVDAEGMTPLSKILEERFSSDRQELERRLVEARRRSSAEIPLDDGLSPVQLGLIALFTVFSISLAGWAFWRAATMPDPPRAEEPTQW